MGTYQRIPFALSQMWHKAHKEQTMKAVTNGKDLTSLKYQKWV